jgi:hypothetical protein
MKVRALGLIAPLFVLLHGSPALADVGSPPTPSQACQEHSEGDQCYDPEFADCVCRMVDSTSVCGVQTPCLTCLHPAEDGGPFGEPCLGEQEEGDTGDYDRDGDCSLRVERRSPTRGFVLLALLAAIGYFSLRRSRSSRPPKEDDEQ